MSKPDLRKADLEGADVESADLSGANLTNAAVTCDELGDAISLAGAIMPEGTVHE